VSGSPETIAVVVVTFNSERFIPDLVASLAPGLDGLAWHLTVADNASSDQTLALLKEHAPDAKVVETGRNAGYAAGINAAVTAAAPHTAVLVLNPDIRLRPGCVPAMVEVLRRRGAGIVVPRIVGRDGGFSPSLRREPTIRRMLSDALFGATRMGRIGLGEVITDERRYTGETVADWAEGSILLIDRACWDACGSWDESFFLYSEETEYALRARDHGFRVVLAPTATAWHLEGESASSPPLWTLLTLNRVRLYRRRHGLPGAAVYWAVLLMRETSRAMLGNPCSRAAARALISVARLRETPGPLSIAPGR
jgi:GT2 family glycosyltransferase